MTFQTPASARRRPRTAVLAVAFGLAVVGAGAVGVSKGWLRDGEAGPTGAASAPTGAASAPTGAAPTPSASTSGVPSSAPAPAGGHKCPEGMAYVAAGTFRMGSEPGEPDAYDDEQKPHEVKLSAFCLDVTEVTVADYQTCVNAGKCTVPETGLSCNWGVTGKEKHPVNCVDWLQSTAFCVSRGCTLPSEAQWEYAAAGKERRKYPWGPTAPTVDRLNACGAECRNSPQMYPEKDPWPATAPVGQYPKGATPEGAHDLAGNVWEWVQDRYADYDPSLSTEPVQTKGTLYVLRGGSWSSYIPRWVRAADRSGDEEGIRDDDVGFRCACGPNP